MKKDTHLILGMVLVAVAIVVIVRLPVQGGAQEPTVDSSPQVSHISFTKLAEGTQSSVVTRTNYLVTSTDELERLWKLIDATTPSPEIDFSKDAVVAVFAGEKPTTGHAISVTKIEDTEERMVLVTLAEPGGDCMTGQALTTPYEIVIVPLTTLPFTHKDASITTACTN